MPYPLPPDDELYDLLEPRERMLFELLQNQTKQTIIVMQALVAARWWAVVTSTALTLSLLTYAWALLMHC